jgi:hypothetical protein
MGYTYTGLSTNSRSKQKQSDPQLKHPVAHAIVRRIPTQGLYILRNLILTDLKPYMDNWDQYDFKKGEPKCLCDQLNVVKAELIHRNLDPGF